MLVFFVSCTPAFAWPGFTWEEWRAITGVDKPAATSPQAGTESLLPLTADIDSVGEWEAKRDAIKATLAAFLGEPTPMTPPAPSADTTNVEDTAAYERIHLRIASEADDTIPAYLLKPKTLPEGRHPIVIVLHQTQSPGKREACGMIGDPNMAFADELAKRGMLCIAPDAIGFGERIPEDGQPYANALDFYRKHPHWSFFGKMSWDIARIIDYLETLPYVDPQRIGVIGHSHGAYGSIMATVFEPRIRLAVASCGFTTLRTDPRPDRWSHLTALWPQLGFYMDDVSQIPFDWHEIIACIAPRPFFNWATLNDDIFPGTANLEDVYAQVKSVYGLYGREDDFQGRLVPGAHRFPPEAREEAYAWIEAQWREME
jgi:dienelactone hydrolase